jgi:hypothetical protein
MLYTTYLLNIQALHISDQYVEIGRKKFNRVTTILNLVGYMGDDE